MQVASPYSGLYWSSMYAWPIWQKDKEKNSNLFITWRKIKLTNKNQHII